MGTSPVFVQTKDSRPFIALQGTVERILFTNPETQYTVASLLPEGHRAEVTIVGNLAGLQQHEVLRVEGQYINDKRYGRQFKVERYTPIVPATAAAIEKFLGCGLIKGIGKVYAKKLVAHFGSEIFDIVEQDPNRLRDIPGIGIKRVEMISRGWMEHQAIRKILMFLQQYEIPQGFAARIYRQYGDKAIEQIQKNPYQLALDVRGIGFKSADLIAEKIGIPRDSIERCKAGVYFLLQELASEGHCFYPADPLIEKSVEALQVSQERIVSALNALKKEDHIVLEILPDGTRAIYLTRLHAHEMGSAELIARLLNTGKLLPKICADADIAQFEQQHSFKLAENQRTAVKYALSGGVLVITGGPGTGKTTIIRSFLRILNQYGVTTLLAAPTGRAAKRMHELTHADASTIHRLLQFSPQEGKYLRNPQNPLKADVIIIDESSMVDIALAHALLRAIPATSSLILVGDVDQLPSVGPGNFLHDVIASGVVPVVKLNEIFRQAQQSMIITNAHRVNQGITPVLSRPEEAMRSDFYFVEAEDPEEALKGIKELVQQRIPAKFGFKPPMDIQVLAPMHRGVVGAQNLNRELQQLLNPGASGIERSGSTFRVGDKVMQMTNDYDKDVFNGDIGTILSVDREDHLLRVNFDGHIVAYDFNELDEIELAYAISIHKSQGSEYKAVVVPVHTTHFIMLQRNLLYTAITRGKKLVCLVGQKKAIDMAVKNYRQSPRHSALDQKLASLRQVLPSPRPL